MVLPEPGRTNHEHIVATRGRNLESTLGRSLAAHVAEIGHRGLSGGGGVRAPTAASWE